MDVFTETSFLLLGYYGISLSATNFNSNKFVSSILTSLIEIPSYMFCSLVMDSWGRKPIFSSALILAGAACIPVGLLEDGNVFKTVLSLLGMRVKEIYSLTSSVQWTWFLPLILIPLVFLWRALTSLVANTMQASLNQAPCKANNFDDHLSSPLQVDTPLCLQPHPIWNSWLC